IDLDNFKKINDRYGHLFGDKVLINVSKIIKNSIRDIDYAFRFGGDEFVVMIFADFFVLKKVALRIKEKITSTSIDGVTPQCSIGYAHYPTDSFDLEEVLDMADKRMYENKRLKKAVRS
ncbi:GGDEF domain-containing protein, partial [Nautilia sp.]